MNSRRQVLVVDDQEINRGILAQLLAADYDVMQAEDGRAALKVLRNHPQNISAVLLDLIMPKMDGYAVLAELQKDPRLSGIPVIVVSQADKDGSEARALQLGARDFLSKPYNPSVLRRRLANLIELYESRLCIDEMEHDQLTGLYNKEAFSRYVTARLESDPDTAYMLVATDIERFKLVNDSFGTEAGDELLRYTGEQLRRQVDMVDGICCRHSSDHFVALAPQEVDDGGLATIIKHVAKDFARYPLGMKITFKFGVYPIDDPSVPVSLMYDRAIIAAESVKGRYHNVCAYYDDSIRHAMLREQQITNEMKRALDQEEFLVYLQPKYSLVTEKIVGAEALVRWQHPTLGFMNPGEFIPLFEKNGFIVDLDRYVWETSCKGLRQWMDLGYAALPVSVNVSRVDLYDPDLGQFLLALMQKYRLAPKYMSLEITESAYTENTDQLVEAVDKLRRLGFLIEMDDFGSGYSSLNTLARLPIDVLKLDVDFLRGDALYNGRNILSFIVSLAKWMNLRVIAEGVETEEHRDLLRALNCDMAQGYLFARPMPIPDFEDLLRTQLSAASATHEKTVPSAVDAVASYGSLTLLVCGAAPDERTLLTDAFCARYLLAFCADGADVIAYLTEGVARVAAVVCTVGSESDLDTLSTIVDACTQGSVPVLGLHETDEFISAALEHGATDCIRKPFLPSMMANRLENAICRLQVDRLEHENTVNDALREMKQRAQQDSLTGLLNRTELESRVQDFLEGNPSPEAVFLMADMDDFKNVNDVYGHAAGDETLKMAAQAFEELFPETELIGRMSGDEFALMIPFQLDEDALAEKMDALHDRLSQTSEVPSATFSAGICLAPADGQDFQTLYERADKALRDAKRGGRPRYRYYTAELEDPSEDLASQRAAALLDQASDATFVSDAESSEVLYINDTACKMLGKSRGQCLGTQCHQLVWNREDPCSRCASVDCFQDTFYEEDGLMADGVTRIHLKIRTDVWDGQTVKIHYLQVLPS